MRERKIDFAQNLARGPSEKDPFQWKFSAFIQEDDKVFFALLIFYYTVAATPVPTETLKCKKRDCPSMCDGYSNLKV